MTLLFQFVTAPPLQPRPHLPASVRGGLADRIDPLLAVVMGASLFFHSGLMFYVSCSACVDPDRGGGLAEKIYDEVFTEERVATMEPEIAKPTEGEVGTKPAEAPKDPVKGPDKKPAAGSGKPDKGGGPDKPGPTQEELEEQMALEVETMLGEGMGQERGGMRDRDPGSTLADEAREVEEGGLQVKFGTGGDDRGPRRGDNKRATGDGPNLNTGKGTEGTGGTGPAKVAKVPEISVKKEEIEGGKAGTPEAILAKIKSQYVHGLKQCFKKVLLVDENASGTLRLKFTVSERGNTTGVAIKGFGYPELDSCVQAKVGNWVFNAPKDDDGEPTTIDVKLSLPFTGR
jgi:hypothetical protein